MIGSRKVFILISVALSSCAAKQLKCEPAPVIYPPYVLDFTQTYRENALRFLNGDGPDDGTCTIGPKLLLYGAEYNLTRISACICLHIPEYAPVNCSDPTTPTCPKILPLVDTETIGHWFLRVGRTLSDAPPNGCCVDGMIRWIFSNGTTGVNRHLCTCFKVDDIEIVKEEIVCVSNSSSDDS